MTKLNQVLLNRRTDIKPIWLMRQAGRYLPEYRVMNHMSFMEKVLHEDTVVELTLQPIRRYDLDAAIIFSDILLVPWAMGQDLEFVAQQGPEFGTFDMDRFFDSDPLMFMKKLSPVYRSITKTRQRLHTDKSLIGFAAAPHTLLHYMIQDHITLSPRELEDIQQRLIVQTVEHLSSQIAAGCDVVQIFDSHAGTLKTDSEVMRDCIMINRQIVTALRMRHPEVPIICFPKGLLPDQVLNFCKLVNPSCISIDYNMDPEWAMQMLSQWPMQGGLDPKKLLGDPKNMLDTAKRYMDQFKNHPYVFNLGHGVLKQTKPQTVQELIDFVRQKII